jgi:hypothetical protein
MRWPWTRRAPDPEPTETPLDLKHRLDALERAYDDLHDQFRRFRGRATKRMALDEAEAREAAPANGAAPAGRAALPSVAALRAAGRYPFTG